MSTEQLDSMLHGVLTCMLLTHSWVMELILPLLAPGALSVLRDASWESRSLMILVAMMHLLCHTTSLSVSSGRGTNAADVLRVRDLEFVYQSTRVLDVTEGTLLVSLVSIRETTSAQASNGSAVRRGARRSCVSEANVSGVQSLIRARCCNEAFVLRWQMMSNVLLLTRVQQQVSVHLARSPVVQGTVSNSSPTRCYRDSVRTISGRKFDATLTDSFRVPGQTCLCAGRLRDFQVAEYS